MVTHGLEILSILRMSQHMVNVLIPSDLLSSEIYVFIVILEVIMVKQQPSMANDDQPNIAVICVNYYEKLAVDAMMTNKVTFVRHKPEGESFKYFLSYITQLILPDRIIKYKNKFFF